MGEIIVQGATMAAIYALVAVSLNIIYRPTNIFNFAQGDLLMVGALLAAVLARGYAVQWYAAAAIALGAVALLAMIIDLVAVSPVIARHGEGGGWIISTLAASIIIHEIADKLAGPDPRVLPAPPPLQTTPIDFGAFSASSFQIGLVVFVCALVAATEMFYRTRPGRAVRAIAEDREASLLRGINPTLVTRLSFAVGGAVAAAAGILAAPILFASTSLGWLLLLKGFLIVAVGGIGSNGGAILAALIVGMIEAVTARTLTPGLQEATSFVVVLAILLVRPQGIFGSATGRTV
jgi:branched-chain amino acid transport system permease protein